MDTYTCTYDNVLTKGKRLIAGIEDIRMKVVHFIYIQFHFTN